MKRIINIKLLMAILGLILAYNESKAEDCSQVPDCQTLGYTMTSEECSGHSVVKCPFDVAKVFCSKDNTFTPDVKVGDILYGDGTVSSSKLSDKEAIGVVFDNIHRLAVAVTTPYSGRWAEYPGCNIPSLEKCSSEGAYVSCGTDGKSNTDIILSSCAAAYAASYTRTYEAKGCSADFCKKGKWFLPSMSELYTLLNFLSPVNETFEKLGVSPLATFGKYWSSTDYNGLNVWYGHSKVTSYNPSYQSQTGNASSAVAVVAF